MPRVPFYLERGRLAAWVPQQKVDTILEAARLSASSGGMQPYKIIVIENVDLKKKLQSAAYNQPQITEASHLLVFAAFENVTAKDIDDFISLQARVKNVSTESMDVFKDE